MEIFTSIHLNKESKDSLYMQLYGQLKEMIINGTLSADFRLPSIRQLTSLLNVNQVTVVSAYRQLESDGYIYSRPGSGTYVSKVLPSLGTESSDSHPMLSDELYLQDDLSLVNNGQVKINENTINFASATPTPDLFPVENFKTALNEVLERDKGSAFSYQDSQGFFPLRECIPEILKKIVGHCSPDNIQIISGAQQGIDIISKTFLNKDDYVITESPTYTGAIAVFRSRGAQVAEVDIKEGGPDMNVLEYYLQKYKPRLIYTIPSYQNPTGYSYTNVRRKELLRLADKYNAYIIEDDYVSDLRFTGPEYLSLKSMDTNDRVIFIKSFSKIFMPGLRLGFMIVPSKLQGNVIEAKHTTDISTSGLIQRAFDLYIRKGFWDRHLHFMYEIYKERYLKTVEALKQYLPGGVSCSEPGGGLNLWLSLPYGFSSVNLLKHAAYSNIVFAPGHIFYSSNSQDRLHSLRLSYAAVYTEQIAPGIARLCELIDSLMQKQSSYRNMPIL